MPGEKKPRIIIAPGATRWASACADFFRRTAEESVARSGRFMVALSGGSTPRPVHRLLATPTYRADVPWTQTHIFWADERMVPADDPASNFGIAREDLLDHLPIPAGHVHPMCSTRPVTRAADEYQTMLAACFQTGSTEWPVFDLVFLGIGRDGHTASIFPGNRTAIDTTRWVVAVKGGSPNVDRLTLTLPLLERARNLVFLVSGADKAEITRTLLTGETATLPPQYLATAGSRVAWFIDRDAAQLLPAVLKMKEG